MKAAGAPGHASPVRRARRALWALALAAALLPLPARIPPPSAARAQTPPGTESEPPAIPVPVGFVNDRASLMDEPSRARLEAFLDQLKQKTGVEFGVLTVETTAPSTPDEYKVRVFASWGLGQKGGDNGVLLLVSAAEREVRFETGYGLEGTLPDGFVSRVVRTLMAPRFREKDYAGGITQAVLACAARIGAERGVALEWNGAELRYDGGGREIPRGWVLALVVMAVLFSLIVRMSTGYAGRRRGGWWVGPWGMGGWGGGSFGGGFGGGGFGGGGASFGGFGGGASGGGGGGGTW